MKNGEQDVTDLMKCANGSTSSDADAVSRLSARETWNPFTHKHGLRRYIEPKRIVLAVLFAGLIALAWYLRQQGYLNPELLLTFISNYPLMAPLIFIAFYALAFLLMVPTLPFNLGAGILWGPVWGGLIATAGSVLGAIGAFAIARTTLGQPLAQRFDNRMVAWLQNEFETKGWHIVAFTRMSPVFPSSLLSFVLGLTSIRFSTYTWSSLAFLFPPALAFAIIGHEVSGFVLEGKMADLIRTILIVSAVITLMIIASIATRLIIRNNHKSPLS